MLLGFQAMLTRWSSREPNPKHDTLAPYLLHGVQDENGLCFDFIREAIRRFDEDESFPALFNNAMIEISTELSAMTLSSNFKPYVQVE